MRLQHPRPGAWTDTSYRTGDLTIHLLRDVVVRSNTGIVTLDGHVVADTLLHIPDHSLPGERVDGGIVFGPSESTIQLGRAAHLMSGGYDNYFHWMYDVVARSMLAEAIGPGAAPLFGIFRAPFHPSTMDLLGPSGTPRRGLGTGVSLEVEELLYVPGPTGFEPHPCILPVFDRLLANAGAGKPPTRRLYVSRANDERRKLLNEREVLALLAMHGFETVQLDGLDVRAQVRRGVPHRGPARRRVDQSAVLPARHHGAGVAAVELCELVLPPHGRTAPPAVRLPDRGGAHAMEHGMAACQFLDLTARRVGDAAEFGGVQLALLTAQQNSATRRSSTRGQASNWARDRNSSG
jgi:hypothetical protein